MWSVSHVIIIMWRIHKYYGTKIAILNFKKDHKYLLEFAYKLRIIDELRDGLFLPLPPRSWMTIFFFEMTSRELSRVI